MILSGPTKIVLAIVVIAIIAGVAYTATMSPQPTAPTKPQVEEPKLRKVTFILNFGTIGGPQAPWFVTLEKGFFREQGLDVEIIPGRTTPYAVQQVAAGKADFGQATADVVIAARVNSDALVKMVYQVYQDNPNGLASLESLGIKTLQDVSGKTLRLGVALGSSQENSWDIAVKKHGIDVSKISKFNIGFDPGGVSRYVSGQIDISTMWDDNVSDFQVAGVKVNYFFFRDYGVNFPTLSVITSDAMIKENPELVRKFVAASDKGFRYAVDHPGEAVDIVMKYTAYSLPKNTVQFYDKLQWALRDIKGSKPGQAMGKFDIQALSELQDVLIEYKKMEKKQDIREVYTQEFLPK